MNRENIDNKYKWDLSLIYKNEEELNKDINKLKKDNIKASTSKSNIKKSKK